MLRILLKAPFDHGIDENEVYLEVSSGTAIDGQDFKGFSERVSFKKEFTTDNNGNLFQVPSGKWIKIPTYRDFETEGSEYVIVKAYVGDATVPAYTTRAYIKESVSPENDRPIVPIPINAPEIYKYDDFGMSVGRLYTAALGRFPDVDGFENARDLLIDEVTDFKGLAQGFIDSPEFVGNSSDSTPQGFITDIYYNVLRRMPDDGGLSYWTNLMSSGVMDEADVLVAFANSPEMVDLFETLI